MSQALHTSILLGAGLSLASCAAVDTVKQTTVSTASKVSDFSQRSLTTLLPDRVQVVEVREKDLEEMPLGRDQVASYEKQRKRGLWFFSGPVDFVEPELPSIESEVSDSLLPPKPN